jgi:hypothetical protein
MKSIKAVQDNYGADSFETLPFGKTNNYKFNASTELSDKEFSDGREIDFMKLSTEIWLRKMGS